MRLADLRFQRELNPDVHSSELSMESSCDDFGGCSC